jgi:hypothetical protein
MTAAFMTFCKEVQMTQEEILKDLIDHLAVHLHGASTHQEPYRRNIFELFKEAHTTEWLIPQFRHNIGGEREKDYQREAEQQVLRATFPGIRDSVRELLGVRADALARQFHETHDINVKNELERLLKEYGKLKEPWMFISKAQNET